MARASYVWVIHKPHGPTHAFTVKHELVSFLRRFGTEGRSISRLGDGDQKAVVTWPQAAQFLEDAGG